ncbi:MAG TPA: hypothetical protein VKP68_01570 [Ramlibacter sp.]|nr:hypothetical protein [Ramlibacter sp.]
MSVITEFEQRLPASLVRKFQGFCQPMEIQRYLDSLAYIGEERDRCPLDVMRDGQCHCLDGGLFAALALRKIGYPGLLVDIVPKKDRSGRNLDDDHVLAVFRRQGRWGALAKSNFVWLRYREPVYRDVRELVMSYFEAYFSVESIKVLHGYTRPLDIARFDSTGYAWDEPAARALYRRLYARKEVPVVSAQAARLLRPVDRRQYDSGMLGVNWDWVYRPGKH